jgi:hypothetical protein
MEAACLCTAAARVQSQFISHRICGEQSGTGTSSVSPPNSDSSLNHHTIGALWSRYWQTRQIYGLRRLIGKSTRLHGLTHSYSTAMRTTDLSCSQPKIPGSWPLQCLSGGTTWQLPRDVGWKMDREGHAGTDLPVEGPTLRGHDRLQFVVFHVSKKMRQLVLPRTSWFLSVCQRWSLSRRLVASQISKLY